MKRKALSRVGHGLGRPDPTRSKYNGSVWLDPRVYSVFEIDEPNLIGSGLGLQKFNRVTRPGYILQNKNPKSYYYSAVVQWKWESETLRCDCEFFSNFLLPFHFVTSVTMPTVWRVPPCEIAVAAPLVCHRPPPFEECPLSSRPGESRLLASFESRIVPDHQFIAAATWVVFRSQIWYINASPVS